jgi:hypothetical protein
MTEAEFNEKLAAHGCKAVVPATITGPGWGLIDIGNGVMVDRWKGGSTLAEQLRYCLAQKKKVGGECEATACSSRWVKAKADPQASKGTKAVKKAAKKVAKKGGSK